MTRGRHSLAPRAKKARRLAFLAAPLVTCAVVGAGVAVSGSPAPHTDRTRNLGAGSAALGRTLPLSRSAERDAPLVPRATPKPTPAPPPKAVAQRWTTTDLNLRLSPSDKAKVSGLLEALKRIGITGRRSGPFAEVVWQGQSRWVTAEYLSVKKPSADPAHLPLGDKPCPGTSSVEHGLTDGAIRVYRAVCNNFPQITQYGGWDAHGEHSSGKAIDIMTSDVALGTRIAEFLQAHAAELDLYDIIWRQHIWTPERASEGWRSMPDRGSATANHYDHVHVSVN